MKPAAESNPAFSSREEALRFLAANALGLAGLACIVTAATFQDDFTRPLVYALLIVGFLLLVVPSIYLHFMMKTIARRMHLSSDAAHWLSRKPSFWREAVKTARQ